MLTNQGGLIHILIFNDCQYRLIKQQQMQREKLQLPELFPKLASSRITSFQDYHQWQKQKKKAYRAQLQQEIQSHNKNRQKFDQLKFNQRANLNTLVKNQQKVSYLQRSAKIKTEQKYMQDNYNLMKRQSKSPRRIGEQVVYQQHPFVNLMEKEQKRKEQTKNSFIYQNKLNDMQSQMKNSMKERKKLFEAEQRRKYIDHIEQEFNKHQQQRRFFQNKYLKIDKKSKKNFKKEHLEYLRDQANLQKSQDKRRGKNLAYKFDESNQAINATGGNIGLNPIHYDRKRQLQTLQKSLKLFSSPKTHQQSNISLNKQYELNMGVRLKQNDQKIVTQNSYREMREEKQVARTERAQSSLNDHGNAIKYKHFIHELSENPEKPIRQARYYKHYDIIQGTDKVFVR